MCTFFLADCSLVEAEELEVVLFVDLPLPIAADGVCLWTLLAGVALPPVLGPAFPSPCFLLIRICHCYGYRILYFL